ncbi:perlucin-like [Haliotis rufescens]|uniref:perlucin-like n=1 Tax=Haliotis rufescens TaxID=6454 RepID=UPI00201F81E7|nr:perlucin-like [Haliotis rufescens]
MMKASQSQQVWIGAYDTVTEGDFRWVGSKEKLNFTDWSAGEPNSQTDDENCVEMSVILNYQWNDDTCTVKKQFICEGSPGENVIG